MSSFGNEKIRIGIFGASGYGGSELLRILLFHPKAEIVFGTANEHAGKPVSDVHKNLLGITDLRFDPLPDDMETIDNIDLAFFALPHGQAMSLVPRLSESISVIDLSGDFRLSDAEECATFYGFEQSESEYQSRFIYGLTEANRDLISSARYVANPGCFATATSLALAPLVDAGILTGKVIVDAKTGSSGSGIKPAANTHHPQRMNSFYAYKPFVHQHMPEIRQHLRAVGDFDGDFVFMTHSLPLSRGIFASCYAETDRVCSQFDLEALFQKYYENSFFVRIVKGSPDVNWVKNTNFCDIAVNSDGRNVVIFAALDNLVKGAAGQAVQNMNLMFGLDEKTGLVFTGSNP
jgi:N-acetyl-gamma-glutamyl-phosphate reductase